MLSNQTQRDPNIGQASAINQTTAVTAPQLMPITTPILEATSPMVPEQLNIAAIPQLLQPSGSIVIDPTLNAFALVEPQAEVSKSCRMEKQIQNKY